MPRPRRAFLVAFVLIAIVGAVLLSMATRASLVRERVVTALNDRFASQVDLESLQVAVFPRPELSGSGVSVRWDGRTDRAQGTRERDQLRGL